MAGEKKSASPLAYNPRCAKRDLTNFAAASWLTPTNLYNLTIGPASKNVGTFQDELQGRFSDGFLGMHAAGHFSIGGDGGDFYSSPNDPVFFLHHAMLDRVWWIWQALHLNQYSSVAGTVVPFQNTGAKTTLKDLIQMNWLNVDDVTLEEVMSTLDGEPLCYIYL